MKGCSLSLLAVSLFALVLYCPSNSLAQSYTESVLYNFPSANLAQSNVVLDSAGNLYGLTYSGGTYGVGSIFEISASGAFSTIYNFNPNNYGTPNSGYYPWGLVIDSAGNLYGTTNQGGLIIDGSFWGGVVFKFSSATKKYAVLHKFGSLSSDGNTPAGPLTFASDGNLYGMTNYGGTSGYGTIFEVTPKGVETVKYSFPSTLAYPTSNVFRDGKGNFYGLADYGTTLVEVTASGQSKILNNGIGAIGSELYSVGRSAAGNFYGQFGYESASGLSYSGLWEVRGSDDTLSEYYFADGCSSSSCPSLSVPDGPFVFSNGNIYGTSIGARDASGAFINGAVYEFNQTTGVVNTLYSFCSLPNCADGSQPRSGVALDSKGNLYGTTWSGGTSDNGVVFKLTLNN